MARGSEQRQLPVSPQPLLLDFWWGGTHVCFWRAELVVVDGQLVMQPRASPRQEQSVREVRVNDSRSL